MYRTIILPVDAIMAVSLVDLSMQDCTISDTVDALHSTFQKYPDFEYLCMAKKLLTQLNLFEIWREELLYYAKLLRIDNKTLENEIENRRHAIFAQVDDVEDSNIPLSATLVNNSYFNNKKGEKENQKDAINSKLAATFVKHAALNKNERIPEVHKKNTKRMRKEVVLNKNGLQNETKRIKREKNIKQKVQVNDSENEDFDVNKALNAVPSVNDVFNDLGMDFNIANSLDVLEDIDGKPNDLCNSNQYKSDLKIVEAKLTNSSSMNNIYTKEIEDSTRKKLKQFQFTSKSDLGRHNDETVKQVSESNTVIGKSSSNSSENKTVGTSQTIIFESGFDSDWDI